ncbi:MAG TPA: hypothetical protein VIG99_27510 [Myxococcaceae bacterium]
MRDQELYIANHLGATWRRQGHLLEAYDLFRDSIAKTRLPEDLYPRARLYGNLGALFDEIGDVSAADDCYARYEELIEYHVLTHENDKPDRLANARALAARAAFRRGDVEAADRKYREEHELAYRSTSLKAKLAADLHRAKLDFERGGDHESSRHRFGEIAEQGKKLGELGRAAEARHYVARVLDRQRHLAEAYGIYREVLQGSADGGDSVRYAKVCHDLASLCQRSALHGEALWYLRQAADTRFRLYQPLQANQRLRDMARTRLAELRGLAHGLVEEAGQVVRTSSEREELEVLFGRLGETPQWQRRSEELLWDWNDRLCREANTRWREELLPGAFDKLGENTRQDLIRADMAYHGAVDDLARSAHLLALAVERELRDRLLVPLWERHHGRRVPPSPPAMTRYFSQENHRCTLGQCLKIVEELGQPAPGPDVERLRGQLGSGRDALPVLVRLLGEIRPLGDSPGFTLVAIRNQAAHGDVDEASLGRLAVDAIKRTLVLEAPAILRALAEIDLRE